MLKALEIDEEKYTKYMNENFKDTRIIFTQFPEYANLKKDEKTKSKKIAVIDKETGEILALTIVIFYQKFKIFYKAEILYGPIIKEKDYYRFAEILTAIRKKIFKNLRVLKLRITPIVYKHIYKDINIIKKDINKNIEESILKEGFRKNKEENYQNVEMPFRYFYSKNIENIEYKEIENSFVRTFRNRIKKSEKELLQIRFLKYNEIDVFYKMLLHTYGRVDTNQSADMNRLKNMHKEFKDKVYFPVIYIDILKTEKAYIDDKNEKTNELKNINKTLADKEISKNTYKKAKSKKEQLEIAIKSLEKNIEDIKKLKEEETEKGNKDLKIDIYGGVFIDSRSDFIYFLGGGYDKYFKYNAAPKMHKEMLKIATEKNKKIYNLFGISGVFNEDAPDYGVLKFKQTFNGYVEEFIGTYDYNRFNMNI